MLGLFIAFARGMLNAGCDEPRETNYRRHRRHQRQLNRYRAQGGSVPVGLEMKPRRAGRVGEWVDEQED